MNSVNNTNYLGINNISRDEAEDALNLEELLVQTKMKMKDRLSKEFNHLRDDDILFGLINKHYLYYFDKYKETHKEGEYFFEDLNNLKLTGFKYNEIFSVKNITDEKEFAKFMFKVMKLYIFLITNKELETMQYFELDRIIGDFFLKFITSDS